ncbi:MAG TPA: hypothetical protein VGM88_02770 [Kofleriaceae bacterium]|jgi:hypothetical protein
MKWLALMFALAACGDDGGNASDGGAPDGAEDVGPGSGATIVFHANRLGDRGPVVYCRDPSGAITQRTDVGNGLGETHVDCPMVAGGSIDVLIDKEQNTAQFVSFRHLEPGAVIEADPPVGSSLTDDGTMTITVPSSPTVAGAASCGTIGGASMTSATLHAYSPCDADPEQVLVTDDAFTPTQYIYLPSAAFTAGGTLDAGPWQAIGTTPATYTGLPANVTEVDARVTTILASNGGLAYASIGEVAQAPTAGTAMLALPVPGGSGVGEATMIYTYEEIGTATVDEHVALVAQVDALAIDHDELPLPRPATVTPTATGVQWTESGPPGGDFRGVFASWTLGDGTILEWAIFDDPTSAAGSVTIAPLAAADSDIDLTAAAGTPGLATVEYLDFDAIAGWSDARARIPEIQSLENAGLAATYRAHETELQSH